MTELIGATLLLLGLLLGTLGVLKSILVRERQKATVVLMEYLISNYKTSKEQ